jgi:hypothetical protein
MRGSWYAIQALGLCLVPAVGHWGSGLCWGEVSAAGERAECGVVALFDGGEWCRALMSAISVAASACGCQLRTIHAEIGTMS